MDRGFLTSFPFVKLTWLVIAGVIFLSCSPAARLRRAKRLIAAAVEDGAKVKSDTLFAIKAIQLPKIERDFEFRLDLKDTLQIIKLGKDTFTVRKDTIEKKIFVHADINPDTVFVKVPYAVNTTISAGYPWWYILIAALAGIGLGIHSRHCKKII